MRALVRSLAIVLVFVGAAAAAALDLDGAKAQGLVGERLDGYVGAVAATPSAEVKALVEGVNAKRKAAYAEIAKRNGTDPAEVAKLAAQKLVERAASGEWIFVDGAWGRKK